MKKSIKPFLFIFILLLMLAIILVVGLHSYGWFNKTDQYSNYKTADKNLYYNENDFKKIWGYWRYKQIEGVTKEHFVYEPSFLSYFHSEGILRQNPEFNPLKSNTFSSIQFCSSYNFGTVMDIKNFNYKLTEKALMLKMQESLLSDDNISEVMESTGVYLIIIFEEYDNIRWSSLIYKYEGVFYVEIDTHMIKLDDEFNPYI